MGTTSTAKRRRTQARISKKYKAQTSGAGTLSGKREKVKAPKREKKRKKW